MTILIGLKQDDYVLITGDTKSAHMNGNRVLGTYDSIAKVYPICENMIIGIAGSDRIGKAIVHAIKPIFSLNHKLSVKEMIQHVQKAALFLHNMYKQVHTDKDYSYSLLELVIACMDHRENKSYLYSLSSPSGFEPVECKQDVKVYGVKSQKVEEFICMNMLSKEYENKNPVHLFSAGIRSIDDQFVSKDTISFILHKDKTGDYLYVDRQGNERRMEN